MSSLSHRSTRLPRIAVAVFVKTPGVSPLKTRLAAGIGVSKAHAFYDYACNATRSVIEHVAEALDTRVQVDGFWAIAEKNQNAFWPGMRHVQQGGGSLGDRLETVYESLLAEYDYVCLMGADSPHLNVEVLENALLYLIASDDFVLGPAFDGGFYLFGGNCSLPRGGWQSVRYSQTTTMHELVGVLREVGGVRRLEPLHDVDELDDLLGIYPDLQSQSIRLTAAQQQLSRWLVENFEMFNICTRTTFYGQEAPAVP